MRFGKDFTACIGEKDEAFVGSVLVLRRVCFEMAAAVFGVKLCPKWPQIFRAG